MKETSKTESILKFLALPLIAISANLVLSFSGFLSYYLNNAVGFSVVLAGSFVTIFRIWDAVTDAGMGMISRIKQAPDSADLRRLCCAAVSVWR